MKLLADKARGRFAQLAMAGWLMALSAFVHGATVTGTWPAGQTGTQTANIPYPANTQVNSFTGVSGNWNYVAYPFTVTASGNYTATSTTATSVNTTWFVRGNFVPGQPMGTPVADFFAGVLAGGTGGPPYTGNFPSVPLVAGQQYTMLVAYNFGSLPGELSTVTINGPGCVAIGANVCTPPASSPASIPTLSEWGILLMAAFLAIAAVFTLRRKSATLK